LKGFTKGKGKGKKFIPTSRKKKGLKKSDIQSERKELLYKYLQQNRRKQSLDLSSPESGWKSLTQNERYELFGDLGWDWNDTRFVDWENGETAYDGLAELDYNEMVKMLAYQGDMHNDRQSELDNKIISSSKYKSDENKRKKKLFAPALDGIKIGNHTIYTIMEMVRAKEYDELIKEAHNFEKGESYDDQKDYDFGAGDDIDNYDYMDRKAKERVDEKYPELEDYLTKMKQ